MSVLIAEVVEPGKALAIFGPPSNLEVLAAKGRAHGKRKLFSHIAWPGPSPSPLVMRISSHGDGVGGVVFVTLFYWLDFLFHVALSKSRIHTQGGFSLQKNPTNEQQKP